jgi:hypothetical protein
MVGFLFMKRLKVHNGQVLLSIKGQKINTQNREVVFRIRIEHGVEDLSIVTRVVLITADALIKQGCIRRSGVDFCRVVVVVVVSGSDGWWVQVGGRKLEGVVM